MDVLANSDYYRSISLLDGKGVAVDFAGSFSLNLRAAERVHHDAVLAMGWFYLNGIGVEEDLVLARKWYRKSARSGEKKAMFSLGVVAVQLRDYAEAHRWFKRAANAGHHRSLCWLGKLHWHGHGTPASRLEAMRFFHMADGKKDPEARRILRFFSRPPRKPIRH